MAIEYISFDLGGVFFLPATLDAFAENLWRLTGKSKDRIGDAYISRIEQWDTGQLTAEQFWDGFTDELEIALSAEQLSEMSFSKDHFDHEVADLAERLRKNHTIGVLSDVSRELFDYHQQRHGLIERFDYVFTSFEIGATKRSPEAFHAVAKTVGIPHESIVHIDDRQSCIAVAESTGMNTICYSNVKQLEEALVGLGVR